MAASKHGIATIDTHCIAGSDLGEKIDGMHYAFIPLCKEEAGQSLGEVMLGAKCRMQSDFDVIRRNLVEHMGAD